MKTWEQARKQIGSLPEEEKQEILEFAKKEELSFSGK